MIIFAKADGTVVKTKPTPFYQGSSLKGSIYLVAPFPNTNGVTIQFQLPNGDVTKAYPMTPTGEVEGVMLDGYEVSAWTWDVKNAMVTAIPGMVTATITVYNGEPNITYYGDYATLTKINAIENPQTNAYAYCIADGKVYKYNGNTWTESNITISANDYVKTTIISSFSVIKGTPSPLDVSTPSASEWEAIISALGSIGGKVAMPLMTNFTYNIETGESVKSYNNGMVQTENFPAVLPDTMSEYQSFTKTVFGASDWVASDRGDYSYMLVMPFSTYTNDFDIAVYSVFDSGYLKMNPFTIINQTGSSRVVIYSNEAYAGYALFFWKGSFAEQNYLPAINTAIENAETATAQAENIANTLETVYENGELGIPNGGTAGQILTKTENGTAWQDAPSGGANFSYYSLKPYEDYVNETMACVPNLVDIQKIEIDSYIMKANIFTGSGTSPFVKVFDSSIGVGGANILYENGVKNDISFVIDYIESRIYWDIGSSLILPTRIDISQYDSYNVYEIILKIYPKEV